ncbi:MAG: DUF262 domain-containing protein [Deltaproteobacteria bacterium]|nr:DUF262 domain-containing protein [Deltaproteobacteria bacterium]
MKTFDVTRTLYKVSDFLGWQKAGTLILSPSFQRRSVWKKGAKSYLIDTIVRGLPIPILFIRERRSDLTSFEPTREVVDGQQRIRTLISYISPNILNDLNEDRDIFTVMKSHNKEFAGKTFPKLSDDMKARILDYQFSVHVLPPGIDDREVLQIFARMNSTGTKLNNQELRNAEYFGEFKTSMYETGFRHLNRWRKWKIFTEDNISRMAEVELTSEFAIYMLNGITAKKKGIIDKSYENKDIEFPERKELERRFDSVMDSIDDAFGSDMPFLPFKNKTIFYGLFIAFCKALFNDMLLTEYRKPKAITQNQINSIMSFAEKLEKKDIPSELLEAITRRTTDLSSRKMLIKYFIDALRSDA